MQKNLKPYLRNIFTITFLAHSLSFSVAKAQFDDLEDDFPPPPSLDGEMDTFGNDPSHESANSKLAPKNSHLNSGTNLGNKNAINNTANIGKDNKSKKDKLSKAGIEEMTNENFPDTIESFDFPNADITDIVKAISELTGKNFIVDPAVRGKISIVAPSKITVAEAYKAFLSALAINGYAVIPSGNFLKIRSARNAQRDSIETYSGKYYPNADQMITRIIHLKHISADAVNRDLRILVSKDGEFSPYPQTNSLIISDYGSNIDRVMKIISQLDIPGFEDQLEVIKVKYAKAKDIADLIDKIVNKGTGNTNRNSGAFSSGVPRFSRTTSSNSPGSAYYMVIPDDRTNSLIVTGNKAGIDKIKKLLERLDFNIGPEDSGGVSVYYVQHGDAEKIAQTLNGIAKDAGPKAGNRNPSNPFGPTGPSPILGNPLGGSSESGSSGQEIFGGDVKITADKGTNSLIIVASKQDLETVMNLLRKIDIPSDQVFVETVIMEMKVSDSNNWQIGYFKFDESGAKSGFNGLSTSLNDFLNPAGGAGTILGFGSGDKVEIKNPATGTATKIPSILGFINFLKRNTNANILSTPQILAINNQEANIVVGDKVVVGTTQNTTANGVSTVTPQFEEASIDLKIKPFISPTSDSIRLEIKNSVKQLSTARTPDAFKTNTQPLATRKIETNIVVRNGDTAILGGLMKEDETEDVQKVPLLGDIPIIGWLFKSRTSSKEKTNMLVFLTPKIIRSSSGEDSRKLLNQKLDQRLGFIKSTGGRDPYGETVDQIRSQVKPTSGRTENIPTGEGNESGEVKLNQ